MVSHFQCMLFFTSVDQKNDVKEENTVKVKLSSCLSCKGKRHSKLAHNNRMKNHLHFIVNPVLVKDVKGIS